MKTRLKEIIDSIGIFAVIFGLLFVGYELRQNQLGMEAQTRALAAQIAIGNLQSLREDERLLTLLSSREIEISAVDRRRLDLWFLQYARAAENAFYQYQIGLFEEDEFLSQERSYQNDFSGPEALQWWEGAQYRFSEDFREYFDNLIR